MLRRHFSAAWNGFVDDDGWIVVHSGFYGLPVLTFLDLFLFRTTVSSYGARAGVGELFLRELLECIDNLRKLLSTERDARAADRAQMVRTIARLRWQLR